ncbi:MAG: hypothetical protein ACRD2U_14295 [Terriglobales bacterium]
MNSDPHERARLMIASSGPRKILGSEPSSSGESRSEELWLATHLESCALCREFAESSRETIQSLRGIPVMASERLVSTTKMRVRRRTEELHRQQERLWVVWACCAAVTLSTVISTAVLWGGFEWMGRLTGLSAPVWEGGFMVLYLMPGVLIGILLLAQGTFLADHNGR